MASVARLLRTYPKTTVILLSATLFTAWLSYFRQSLNLKVKHTRRTGKAKKLHVSCSGRAVTSIPARELEKLCDFLYDRAWVTVPLDELPAHFSHEEILNRYLQTTMPLFSMRAPQAWLIRLIARRPEQKQSFQPAHLKQLRYAKGELANGLYRVAARVSTDNEDRVEFDMENPQPSPVRGRLITRVEWAQDEAMFVTEAMMWKPAGSKVAMPLETGLLRFLHECASWWLLLKGTRHLTSLRR